MSDFLHREGESHQDYLGDAVYASFDGYNIWLRTGDGNQQQIALEPAVFDALVRYREKLRADFEARRQADSASEQRGET